METEKIVLTDEMVEQIIAGWEAFKPTKPSRPEPIKLLIYLPMRAIWVSLALMQPFVVASRLTGWRQYRTEYRAWYMIVAARLAEIISTVEVEQSHLDNPQIMKLRNYVIDAGWHIDVGT